jgi:lipid-A-disaccharide synthase
MTSSLLPPVPPSPFQRASEDGAGRGVRIFVGAGEASGDHILAALLHGLRARAPVMADMELCGFGGPLCAAEGLRSSFFLHDLAVNGFGDVFRRGLFLWRVRARMLRKMDAFRPDFVLLVDYPGMNIALARRALRRGIPVHYVAPPQLWAYRHPDNRLRRLRRALAGASLQLLFPFEAAQYTPWKGRLCLGHFFPVPAFEPARGTRLLLCPGSRRGVLRRNLPLWLPRVRAFFGTLEGVDILVPEYLAEEAQALCRVARGTAGLQILTDKERAFERAGAALTFPGTISLELFLRRIPTRAWAILDPLTLWMGRRKLRGPHIALPSAIAGEDVLPEWIGTVADFARRPPELPERIADWNPLATEDAVRTVWALMGSDQGVENGVAACLKLLTSNNS